MRVDCVMDGCNTSEDITEEKLNGDKNIAHFYKCSHFKGTNIFNKKIGVYNICKDCLNKMVLKKDTNQVDENNFISTLKLLNRPFLKDIFDKCMKSKNATFGEYLKRINMKQYKELTYEDGDNEKSCIGNNVKTSEVIISEADKIDRDIRKLLGHNPFDNYDKDDKKFLDAELIPYLDEDTVDDQFKIGVLIQIVNTNNQIRKIDLVINQLSSDVESLIKNSNDIKNLTAIKTQLNQSNDKLSKENSIALKHRGDSKAGKSTLGGIMKDLRELGFEKAEQNYYTMKKAYGMKVSADISNKSIVEILNFDSNDEHNLFKTQKELIQKLQDKELDYKEEIRNLLIENKNVKEQLEKKDTIKEKSKNN